MRTVIGALGSLAVVVVLGAVVQVGTSEKRTVIRSYHSNGRIASDQEMDPQGRQHGRQRFWDASGILRQENRVEHGAVVRTWVFDEHGRLIIEQREGSDYILHPVAR